jgi:uncharacterized membrane protein
VSMTTDDAVGPIDFVLIEFPSSKLTGEVSQEVLDLVDRGTIRLLDLMIIAKDDDGSVAALEIEDEALAAAFGDLSGARSGLLGEEDVAEAASALEPGTVAALLVYENSWAAGFVAAARRSGGELVASGRIPATVLLDALDSLDALDNAN